MGVIMQAFYWNCPASEGQDAFALEAAQAGDVAEAAGPARRARFRMERRALRPDSWRPSAAALSIDRAGKGVAKGMGSLSVSLKISHAPRHPMTSTLGHAGTRRRFDSISVLCGFTSSGVPVGLQIIGAPFQEITVLALAHTYERETEWHERRPKVTAA